MNRALPVVRLRVPTDEDAVAWHRIFDDPDVMEFHGGRSAELSVYEELTARQRRHDAERGFCLWTMLDEAGRVIGFTGAQPWPREWGPTGEIEIGWRLGREHWGKGYVDRRGAGRPWNGCGRRACGAWWRWSNARNERSIAVARRLGMELAETFTTPASRQEGHCYRLAL